MYELLGLKIGKQNKCPFPHRNQKTGETYFESQESSGISEKGQFNCFVCLRGYTDENWFTAAYLGVSLRLAKRWNKMIKETRIFLPDRQKWLGHMENLKEELKNKESKHYLYLKELNLLDIVDDARLGLYLDNITLPTFYKGQIINLCRFRPNQVPKYINSSGSVSGSLTTTRRFDPNKNYILITAGEKDMLTATSNGFNAITFLGGEAATPSYYKDLFKDKKIYIAFDNDFAGIKAGNKLADWLYNYTREIKVINIGNTYEKEGKDLSVVLKEEKEDITDFFIKYKYNDLDLWNIIDDTKWWHPEPEEHQSVTNAIKEVKKTLRDLTNIIKEKNKK